MIQDFTLKERLLNLRFRAMDSEAEGKKAIGEMPEGFFHAAPFGASWARDRAGSDGSFQRHLFHAFHVADSTNTARLVAAFPELFTPPIK